jgi:DNA repair protein RecO (recombination protein O)
MQQAVQGIILQNIRFQDKKNILKVYTLQHGLQSYAIYVGRSKSSKIRPAHILPLTQVELIEHTRNLREVQKVSEMRVTYIYQHLFADLKKNCIATFLNELLVKSLKEQHGNDEIFSFLCNSLKELDTEENPINFHLFFMLELSKYLGFYPHDNYSEKNCLFDLQEGVFISEAPVHPHFSDSETSGWLHQLLRAAEKKEDITLSNAERNELLLALLLFYRLHVPSFGEVRSLPVLKEILA